MDSVLSKNIMIEQNPSSKKNPITEITGCMHHQGRHAHPPRKLSTKAPVHRAPTAAPLGQLQRM